MIRGARFFNACVISGILALPALAAPKAFDPAKDVDIAFHHGVLLLKIPKEVHLKRRFFKVELKSQPGAVTVGELPAASGKDELGDAVWRGTVRMKLLGPGLKDPVALLVTYQPCTEGDGGVCYRPQHRSLTVKASEFD